MKLYNKRICGVWRALKNERISSHWKILDPSLKSCKISIPLRTSFRISKMIQNQKFKRLFNLKRLSSKANCFKRTKFEKLSRSRRKQQRRRFQLLNFKICSSKLLKLDSRQNTWMKIREIKLLKLWVALLPQSWWASLKRFLRHRVLTDLCRLFPMEIKIKTTFLWMCLNLSTSLYFLFPLQ